MNKGLTIALTLIAGGMTLSGVANAADANLDNPQTLQALEAALSANLSGADKKTQLNIVVVALRIVAFLMGIVLFSSSLLRIKKNAENPNNYSIANAIWMLIAGTLLISLGTFYSVISETLNPSFQGVSTSILSVNEHIKGFEAKKVGIGGFSAFVPTETGQTILAFVYLVGMISFVRGIYLLKEMGTPKGDQQGIGQAVTHIIGGALAMNILQFSCILGSFLGTDMICLTGS